jgi:DNA invertase Pin-like site-specific DNA recombinase
MSVYGYIRVSTDKQDANNQRYEILNYGNEKGLGNMEIFSEIVSGRTSWKKRELSSIVEKMKRGDILLVLELSRLGRSLLEIFEIIAVLLREGVEIRVVRGNIILKDDLHSKVITFAFSLAAELERELLSQRTREALARKRSEGARLGRPSGSRSSRLDGKLDEITELRKKRVSYTSIAKIYGVSYTCIAHFCKTRAL